MATSQFSLALEKREKTGTTGSNAARRAGRIPGVVFGHGSEPLAVSADAKAFDELVHAGGRTHLIDVTIGSARDTALVREIQRDPVSRRVLHIDFQRVRATERIVASIPLHTVGVADGVKNHGGVMDLIAHAIDVSAPANALPDALEADVTNLAVHGHFLASDLKLPAKVELAIDPSTILITIEPSRVATEVAEADAAAADLLAEQTAEAQADAVAAGEPVEEPADEESAPEGGAPPQT